MIDRNWGLSLIYEPMRPCYRKYRLVSVWGLLGVVLFLGGVAFVEQLAPELETQTQDEQALAEFSYALKTDQAVIGSEPALGVGPFVSVLNDSFGVPLCPRTLRSERGFSHFKPSSLRLHQRFSIYRI